MRYRGKTPVKSGETVELLTLDNEGRTTLYRKARVRDALASQFTVRFNKREHFYFYEDKGLTWRKTSA